MGPDNCDTLYPDLNRTILEVVLRDFESFESIVSNVSKSRDASDEVRRGLHALLADGLVGAYLIHAEPPYATPVDDPEVNHIEWYWYTTTAQGESCLIS